MMAYSLHLCGWQAEASASLSGCPGGGFKFLKAMTRLLNSALSCIDVFFTSSHVSVVFFVSEEVVNSVV